MPAGPTRSSDVPGSSTCRSFLRLSASALATSALAACGGAPDTPGVTFWTTLNRSDQKGYVERELVAAFSSAAGVPVSMRRGQPRSNNHMYRGMDKVLIAASCRLPHGVERRLQAEGAKD